MAKELRIEYCTSWGYTGKAASLAEQLLAKHLTDISGCTLVPSTGGCFEVSVDGKLVYSKLQSGQFPEFEDVDKHV